MLFNANSRYTVTQTGSAAISLSAIFDGKMVPSYSATAPSSGDPTVILIEGLPRAHIQAGAWVGWSTRYWQAKSFKIEGYDEYYGNGWVTFVNIADASSSATQYVKKLPAGAYTKLRFTFHDGAGSNGRFGVSEIFFIHPEATTPYKGLIPTVFTEVNGNIGIGTNSPDQQLHLTKKLLLQWNDANAVSTGASPTIYASGQGASYPFSGRGNLILQPRTTNTDGYGDFVIMTGETATPKMVVTSKWPCRDRHN